MLNNTVHCYEGSHKNIKGDNLDFVEIGQDLIDSEELTNTVYEKYLSMMVKGWGCADQWATKKDFDISDIVAAYKVGPYIPCVKRISYSRSIDLSVDGIPGFRVVSNLGPRDDGVYLIRPFDPPKHVAFIERTIKKYKCVVFWNNGKNEMDAYILYFGLKKDGQITSPVNTQVWYSRPWVRHGAQQLYPALALNAWSDSRYLWIANASEDIGKIGELKLRLGLSKEYIKSLFYARKLPITETGRKRPILHWVRAHQRRIKEGIDIDVIAHLRGITKFDMHGISFEITQPNKKLLQGAEPETVNDALRLYG